MTFQGKPKVTVGMPVYNGEAYIRRAVDSVLSQTFTDFELILSDNASTDSTRVICEEYKKIDNRIRYIRQEKNKGPEFNFPFVLSEAKSDYFVWIAYDDYWEPTFLEKNLSILETNDNVIGSIGLVDFDGVDDALTKNLVSDLKNFFRHRDVNTEKYKHVHPVSGPYEKKAQIYLRFNQGSFVYGVFRTEKLKQRWIQPHVSSWDLVLILSILKEGDLHVVDEVLIHRFSSGVHSNSTIINEYKRKDIPITDIILPFSSLAWWCVKNVGFRFFLKNLDWFILLTIYGWRSILLEIAHASKNK